MQNTYSDVLRTVTRDYLATVHPQTPPAANIIEEDILAKTRSELGLMNALMPANGKYKLPSSLVPSQIADIVYHLYIVRRIPPAAEFDDMTYDLLGIYCVSGENEGMYVTSEYYFRKIAKEFKYTLTANEFREFMDHLADLAPRVSCCRLPNLVPVNNGIFDYDTKQLLPFSPDYVFLSKCRVNYNPQAKNVSIHNPSDNTDWDVEDWMKTLSDDMGVVQLLWQILGAIIRPNVNWSKAAWFYSTTGNNGKGTLCELMRELVGKGSYASVSLSEMGKNFALESLIGSTAIIVDENDVGTYIDKAANLKALITHDVVQIDRKFKQVVPFRFYGFMVQCLNEMPRVKDKSDSFYRRQIFVPFTKCFTGAERKYIKNDYLHRPEVLEYVLYKVLNMDYYELTVPASCLEALEEYKQFNDPILEFVDEILPELAWNGVPYTFLYELYCNWYQDSYGKKETNTSRKTFTKRIREIVRTGKTDFMLLVDKDDKDKSWRPKSYMTGAEPLIQTYGLTKWMNPIYKDRGPVDLLCTPTNLSENYRGIIRKFSVSAKQ